jgi:EpsI family protein
MRTYRKIFFIAFAFFTGLFANGLRVALIGWWTIGHSETSIHGPFEFFYASFIIFFGLLIVGSARLFSGEKAGGWMENSSHRPTARTLWRELKPSAIFSSALLLAAIVLYYSISSTSRGALLNPIYSFPYEVAGYTGRDVSDADWPFKNVTGDQILRRIYIDDLSGRKIGLLVSYFENQAQDKEIVNQRLMWLHLKESQVTIPVESGRIQVNRGVSRGIADQSYSGDHRIFYFFYYIDSGIETSPYLAKSAILRRALLSRLQDGAIIVFSTENGSPVDTGGEAEVVRFIGKAFPLLREHLRTT